MSEAEQRYAIYDQELLALIRALERLTIKYKPGSETLLADALSRLPIYNNTEKFSKSKAQLVVHGGEEMSAILHEIQGYSMLLSLSESRQVKTAQGRYRKHTLLQQEARETKVTRTQIWTSASNTCCISAMITVQQAIGGSQRPTTLSREFTIGRVCVAPSRQKFISDRGPRFVADLWGKQCKQPQINRALSSAGHPQTDGQKAERVRRTLEQVLRTYIQSDEAAWEDLLPAVELAYKCATNASTGLSPFEVMTSESLLRESDLEVVDAYEPTTPPVVHPITSKQRTREARRAGNSQG
ncbi:hypothetical protein Efla_006623 [Eimeria flavescens]